MLTKVQVREEELERLLADCDKMLETDCRLDGMPLTDEEYKKLWRDIKQYEDELNEIRRNKSQLTEEKEQKEATATHTFCDYVGGMSSEFFFRRRTRDDGMEM